MAFQYLKWTCKRDGTGFLLGLVAIGQGVKVLTKVG